MKRLIATLVPLLLPLACASEESGTEDGPAPGSFADTAERVVQLSALAFVDACVENGEQACDRCRAEDDARVSECYRVCSRIATTSGDVSCASTCADIGNNCGYACPGDATTCKSRGFQFRPIGEPDPSVRVACDAAVARDETCDEHTIVPMCPISERVERAEAAAVYRCLAARRCNTDPAACLELLEQSSLGAEAQARCPESKLGSELVSNLDVMGKWARADVLADLSACYDLNCSYEYSDCLSAWVALMAGKRGYY